MSLADCVAGGKNVGMNVTTEANDPVIQGCCPHCKRGVPKVIDWIPRPDTDSSFATIRCDCGGRYDVAKFDHAATTKRMIRGC